MDVSGSPETPIVKMTSGHGFQRRDDREEDSKGFTQDYQ